MSHLQRIFLVSLGIVYSFLSFSGAFALTEEEQCFVQLDKKAKNDQRLMNNNTDVIFPDGNLRKVLLDERNNSYIDLSRYDEFLANAAKNPAFNTSRRNQGYIDTDFLLRRGHIGTVVGSSNYIVSTIVGFWRDSNFTFPVTSPANGLSEGDPYNLGGSAFKEFIAYTHHSIRGDFLSCGIIKVTPLNGRNFSEIPDAGYLTNVLNGISNQASLGDRKCASWFEGTYLTASDNKEFYAMKANICTLDYAERDFVKMELLSLGYNNGSSYFNEYVVFPLQVRAMTNADLRNDGLPEIRDIFLSYLDTKTCLEMIHPSVGSLPAWCAGTFNSNILAFQGGVRNYIVNNILTPVSSLIFNTSYAARTFNIPQEEIDKAKGMVVYNNFPYDLYKKLLLIENKTFVDFIKISLTPNFETYILKRKEQNIVISPYEEVFLGCNIPYAERERIVIDFVQNLSDPKKIDLNNLTYSNPKFGDCIIPYPDKRNLNKVIPGSFESNQLLAQQLNGTYAWPPVGKDIQDLIAAQNALHLEYQKKVDALTKDFNEWRLSGEELAKKVQEEKTNLETAIQGVLSQANISDEISEGSKKLNTGWMVNSNIDTKTLNTTFYIWIVFLILGLLIVVMVIKKGRKQ